MIYIDANLLRKSLDIRSASSLAVSKTSILWSFSDPNEISGKSPYNVLYFVIQYFFIVVAPVFFSAAIYTILSVAIPILGRTYIPIAPKAILAIFITCDVIATGVQVAGAALIGKSESNREDPTTANNILLAGLAFQCFSFLLFIILSAIFLWRGRDIAKAKLRKGFLAAATAATLLIYLRTCFRLAETADGVLGNLSTHEAYFGALEFAPVVVAVFLFNLWHPGRAFPRDFLTRPTSERSKA